MTNLKSSRRLIRFAIVLAAFTGGSLVSTGSASAGQMPKLPKGTITWCQVSPNSYQCDVMHGRN